MAVVSETRSVDFHVPQPGAYAVQLRLTPALLEALLRAEEEGQGASIRFGAGQLANGITVGDADFRFNALPEECCDLLHLPPAAASGEGKPAAIVGAVRQKLMVQRNIQDERGRVRARAEEAERQGNERKAQLLHGKLSAGKAGQAGKTTTLRRLTPPPQQQPQQPRATPPAGKTTTHPASTLTAAGRGPIQPQSAAAPASAAAARPPLKSASAPKLGGGGGSATPQQTASPLVLQAARSSGGSSLRLCLIAMLSERAMPKGAVMSVLADAAARVPGFKPSKPEIEQMLKKVAEFKAPGRYVLYDMLLKELDTLAPAGSGSCQSGEAVAGRGKQKNAASAPGAAAAGRKAAAAAAAAAGTKRSRLDWSDDDSDAEEQQPAAQRTKPQPQQQQQKPQAQQPAAAYAAAAAAAASPPSISGAAAGGSSSSGGGGGGPTALAAHPRRTSSSRGSDYADESWIEEHADRQPEPAAPITSREEYRRREAAFNAKYLSYFELHQLIQAHKKDYEALDALARDAPTQEERQRYRADLDALHRKRGSCAKRWDAAYRVLHQELAAAKARMAEFVQQLQQQQPAAGASGGASGTLPAVRVK